MATKIWTGATDGNFGTAGNWTGGAPANNDTLYIGGSVSITAGLTSGLTGITLIVDSGYTGSIGTTAGYLSIACAAFTFSPTQGQHFIDLGTSNIAITILNAPGKPTTTTYGLYLKGSNLTTASIAGGSVAFAGLDNETATVATVRVSGTTCDVLCRSGVTLTTASLVSGILTVHCAATTITQNSGTLYTDGSGAITTITQYGGTSYPSSSGTITTHNVNGGTANYITSPVARTVTNLKVNPGGILIHDPAVLTITNKTNPDSAIKVSTSAP